MIDSVILLTNKAYFAQLSKEIKNHGDVEVLAIDTFAKLIQIPEKTLHASRLISFLSPVAVPPRVLHALTLGAFNFHPGPPERPGYAPRNFAIYENSPAFGSTLHRMTETSHTGEIIGLDVFSIPKNIDSLEMEKLSVQSAMRLFKALIPGLIRNVENIEPMPIPWGHRKYDESDFLAYCLIAQDIDAAELELRIRAFRTSDPVAKLKIVANDGVYLLQEVTDAALLSAESKAMRLHGHNFYKEGSAVDFRKISDEQWFEMLLMSTESTVVNGIAFPGFPSDELQASWVGSSNEQAMREAFAFYRLVKASTAALGKRLDATTRVLDFGCGWGRYLRVFRKDIAPENLFGVDVSSVALDECRKSQVAGELSRIFHDGKLPFPDEFFDCVIAYSVFTHLSENAHKHWIEEIARVSKKGCVFVLTLESVRFLDFIEDLGRKEPATQWHKGLRHYAASVPAFRKSFDNGEFVYLPTGGGPTMPPEFYGDAVVPLNYIKRAWEGRFNVIDYVDDANRFWQAVLVAQRS